MLIRIDAVIVMLPSFFVVIGECSCTCCLRDQDVVVTGLAVWHASTVLYSIEHSVVRWPLLHSVVK